MRREVFYLAYHLHWGHADVMDLPIAERWAYVRMLNEQLEAEQASIHSHRR